MHCYLDSWLGTIRVAPKQSSQDSLPVANVDFSLVVNVGKNPDTSQLPYTIKMSKLVPANTTTNVTCIDHVLVANTFACHAGLLLSNGLINKFHTLWNLHRQQYYIAAVIILIISKPAPLKNIEKQDRKGICSLDWNCCKVCSILNGRNFWENMDTLHGK